MKTIYDIDKNFKQQSFNEPDAVFFSAGENMQYVKGLLYEDGFCRMPKEVAHSVSEGVEALCANTAGGRICFRTDSEYIALLVKLPEVVFFPHMPLTGLSSFDIYADGLFCGGVRTENVQMKEYSGICRFDDKKMRDIVINFPLYNDVDEVFVGIRQDAAVEQYNPYVYEKPVVFYGSSITQGGCASRPGLCYTSIASRRAGCDHINLGFSGNAKGEDAMAEYIASLDMSVFVMDYDHNAPTAEHLEKTHSRFFEIIRNARPDLPVIIISRPDIGFSPYFAGIRRDIIRNTYSTALSRGDNKVWFIDGSLLWGNTDWDCCTMDRCHPNDLGFMRMADVVTPVLREALKHS